MIFLLSISFIHVIYANFSLQQVSRLYIDSFLNFSAIYGIDETLFLVGKTNVTVSTDIIYNDVIENQNVPKIKKSNFYNQVEKLPTTGLTF